MYIYLKYIYMCVCSIWGFLETFTIYRIAEEGGGYFFNSSPLLLSASQTLCWKITSESSFLHIASSWTQTRNLWYQGVVANH